MSRCAAEFSTGSRVAALLLVFSASSGGTAYAAEVLGFGNEKERFERNVDEAALSSQEKAISRLAALINRFQGTRQEPVLLAKQAELEQQQATILFRVAHGLAHSRGKSIDLSKYHRALRSSIKTLTILIAKYPSYAEIAQAFYMRGKANEELGAKQVASDDYQTLVKRFPDSDPVPAAYMSLAEFAIEANDHPKAISYLKNVEQKPEDPHFPFALYKLAWSHYNLKEIGKALSYAERQVAYYDERATKDGREPGVETGNVVTSDNALRENTLMDITTFHLDGYESGEDRYKLAETLPYFRRLDRGPILGRMLHRYTKLLRSHGHEADLVKWKDLVIKNEIDRPETLDVVTTVYEYQLNKRRYSQLVETSKDIARLYPSKKKLEVFPRAQKLILDTAEGLQTLIIKNKGASKLEIAEHSAILAQLYDTFTHVVEESDPRIPRVHYNLAETLFTIKDYDGATRHYRWVVEHGSWKKDLRAKSSLSSLDPDAPTATVPDASMKAIASRYEVLRSKNLIPGSLNAKPEKENTDRKFEPILVEWIGWIDAHLEYTYEDMDNFVFEANRVLYAQGHITEANDRFRKFALKYPASTYAIPSASLLVDTLLAGKEWKRAFDLAVDLSDIKEWKGTEFGKRLFSVAADSFYKLIEEQYNKHDYASVLKYSDTFLKKYAASTRLADTLSLAGNSAMNQGDRDRAMSYFSRLITEVPKAGGVAGALLARAQLEEDRYDFAAASADYRSYLALPPAQLGKHEPSRLEALRKKTLMLAWLSPDPEKLRTVLGSKAICPDSDAEDCRKFEILNRITKANRDSPGKLTESAADEAFSEARTASGDLRTLLSALALEGLPHLAFRDRLLVARWASSGWESLDPIIKFSLLPALTVSIPRAFAANRASMKEVAPLRADEKYITRRVEVIREMENAAADVMKLPWARIRASVLGELASLYLDLSHGLSTLPPPKGLTTEELAQYDAIIHKLILPFEEKGQDIRSKAFEIASRAAIEDEPFHLIADPFFQENPSQAKALKPVSEVPAPAPIDLALLSKIDPSGAWRAPKSANLMKIDDPVIRLKAAWILAIQGKHWAQVAFFMSEAQEKALIQAGMINVIKAVSLAQAGARGESLAELEEAKTDLTNPIAKNIILTTLIQHSLRACSRERTLALLKDVEPENLSQDQVALVTRATSYTQK